MIISKHAEFLEGVKSYISDNPEASAYVSEFVAAGVSAALSSAQERAADMEIALMAVAVMKKGADATRLYKDKLKKWEGKTSLNWEKIMENCK